MRLVRVCVVLLALVPAGGTVGAEALSDPDRRFILQLLAQSWSYELSDRVRALGPGGLMAALKAIDPHFSISDQDSKPSGRLGVFVSRVSDPPIVYGLPGSVLFESGYEGPLLLRRLEETGAGPALDTASTTEARPAELGDGPDVVTLAFQRSGQVVEQMIVRDPAYYDAPHYASVHRSQTDPRVLRITEFVYGETDRLTRESLQNYDRAILILDLRANAGGELFEAFELAMYFLEHGQEIAQLSISRGTPTPVRVKTKDAGFAPGPLLLVFVSNHTASAAEVFVRLLRFRPNTYVVGIPTLGKCDAQMRQQAPSGARLAFTFIKVGIVGQDCEGNPIVPDVIMESGVFESSHTLALAALPLIRQARQRAGDGALARPLRVEVLLP